ncbi:VCBS repeat-containing protein [Fodinibius sediminis]|uniref:VCBS repeat-containing protein n=1 Tax=Fodinibius sediminis TaxID=1214077 RepID=UPI00163D8C3A|nr:VCBS repeat-containing protein [Fodinibius sediminis]
MSKFVFAGVLLGFAGCAGDKPTPRFENISADQSNLSFTNRVEQTPDFNIVNYLYFYDGGGVSIGDVNGDGRPDIYLTANMGTNRLYLNEGNFKFRDITERAGVGGSGDWTTGTTMADINGDGLLDIYVSNVHYRTKKGRNQLFINNGDSTFTEKAEEYGLAFRGYSKQAAFFDMDRDGDLDMYLVNHSVHNKDTFKPRDQQQSASPKAGDRLYRNDGETFTDVTEEAGIHNTALGYGLDLAVSDLNGDHYPDLYITNDFHENDYLYLNQGDGTFRDVLPQSTGHTSRASMGSDIADINNDLRPDIAVVDMLPYTEEGLKTAISSEPYELYSIQRDYGYHPQLIRNTLQLNLFQDSSAVPFFADIAPMAGVQATDWSWSALLFDMNNDGSKDLYVSNGIYRRPNNMDYLAMVKRDEMQQSLKGGMTEENISVIDSMPQLKIPNRAYQNEDAFYFSDKTEEWGLDIPSYSNGAAYGDLDNDGDLDIVVNNINSEAALYRNLTREQDSSSYLALKLEGEGPNTRGVGSKAIVYAGERRQVAELFPSRGYQSSVDPRLFFGLGEANHADSLVIIWPAGKKTFMKEVPANQQLTVVEQEAGNEVIEQQDDPKPLKKRSTPLPAKFRHRENDFDEFKVQPFMPYQLSAMGPPLAVADVNGDGMQDLYVGGAARQAGALFLQGEAGHFEYGENTTFQKHALGEDVAAAFFDADGDGHPDLYTASGGDERSRDDGRLADRLYFNDGEGNFSPAASGALPEVSANGSVVVPIDFNSDGRMDLFVGSRSVPGSYGEIPSQYLLENQGDGTFRDVTSTVSPALRSIGMVSAAGKADITGDGRMELVVAGDWMPVTVFQAKDGKLERYESFKSPAGLWQSLHMADVDGDGDVDILAGNMGLNTPFDVSETEPLVMYAADFTGQGNADPIIGYTRENKVFPVAPRDRLLKSIGILRNRFPTYESYANKSLTDIFGEQQLQRVLHRRVTSLASVYFENTGNGTFKIHSLPAAMQSAPIFAFYTGDLNQDGRSDIVAGGNLYDVRPVFGGRYDASYGWFLAGRPGGISGSSPVSLRIRGEIRDIEGISAGQGFSSVVVGINDKAPLFLQPARK